MEYMVQYGVRLFPNSTVDSISDKGVNFWWDRGTENADNIFTFLKADTVVLATGSANDNGLAEDLKGVAPEVHTIGDGAGKRSVFAAIREGSDLGRKI
jgi:hypothetical protein